MTCLLVSHASTLYGSERSLLSLAEALFAQGPVLVLCPRQGPLVQRLRDKGIPVRTLRLEYPRRSLEDVLVFVLNWLPTVLRLWRLMASEGIRVVYNNTIYGLYAPVAARLARLPCIWHVREVDHRGKLEARIFSWLLTRLSYRAVFNSEATMRAYSEQGAANWQVVYNGLPLSDLADRRYVQGTGLVVGFAGSIVERKRPGLFLRAFALAAQRVPGLRALMVGEGPLLGEARAMAARLGIEHLVEMPGFVASMDSFYAQIDIFVLTSQREPFGRVLVEAMMSGCPVIGSADGGVPEVIEHNVSGYLVTSDDPAPYADRIVQLARDCELRKQLGVAGRARAVERFSLARYQDQLMDLVSQAQREGR
jgi:glycosyltransferase involved in cell wall biosynthesis